MAEETWGHPIFVHQMELECAEGCGLSEHTLDRLRASLQLLFQPVQGEVTNSSCLDQSHEPPRFEGKSGYLDL